MIIVYLVFYVNNLGTITFVVLYKYREVNSAIAILGLDFVRTKSYLYSYLSNLFSSKDLIVTYIPIAKNLTKVAL